LLAEDLNSLNSVIMYSTVAFCKDIFRQETMLSDILQQWTMLAIHLWKGNSPAKDLVSQII
jgi:hypothetical protein